jgi:8-oxo-dGTP pyrophosphatase MutT (NUDIX family)
MNQQIKPKYPTYTNKTYKPKIIKKNMEEKEITRDFISTVFVVHENRVLLTWNHKVNNWIPIGGHIEKNQLPCFSVIREAKEESNLDIELISLNKKSSDNLAQPVNVHLDHIKEDHKHINLTYFAKIKQGSPECLKIDDEGKELRWFSKEDLENNLSLLPNVKEFALEALKSLSENN